MPPVSIDMALRHSAEIGLSEWYRLIARCKEWWAVPTLHLLLWQRDLLATGGRDQEKISIALTVRPLDLLQV